VNVISMMPPPLTSALRDAALISKVLLKCGANAWCNGCIALSCLFVAMITGSNTACDRNLPQTQSKICIKLRKNRQLGKERI
jgi:hypothetical protein